MLKPVLDFFFFLVGWNSRWLLMNDCTWKNCPFCRRKRNIKTLVGIFFRFLGNLSFWTVKHVQKSNMQLEFPLGTGCKSLKHLTAKCTETGTILYNNSLEKDSYKLGNSCSKLNKSNAVPLSLIRDPECARNTNLTLLHQLQQCKLLVMWRG